MKKLNIKLSRKYKVGIVVGILLAVIALGQYIYHDVQYRAYSKLDQFNVGLVGIAAHESAQETIFKKILTSSNAVDIFNRSLADPESTIESKIYSICGLRIKGIESQVILTGQASMLIADQLKKVDAGILVKQIKEGLCE